MSQGQGPLKHVIKDRPLLLKTLLRFGPAIELEGVG